MMPPDRRQDDASPVGPAPAEFVLGAAERALARKSPEPAAALGDLAHRYEGLEEDARRFRALAERVPAIVYIADAGESGRWHYVGPQIEAMLGYTPEEWMASPELWADRLHPGDREKVFHDEAQAVGGTPGVSASEYRLLTRDGREVWIRDDALLVEVGPGELH